MVYPHNVKNGDSTMVLAIPVTAGKLTSRFGECESYIFIPADRDEGSLGKGKLAVAPPHAMHHLPDWIVKMGGQIVIAGAMTGRTRTLFEYHGLKVITTGDTGMSPEDLARAWVDGSLDSV